ncbi:hypothetical protein BVRB_8g195790 [Beta vulgaris subsp. vulgaris]|nr:hypothetical protein BVRB_8g195790 [Beta vulgaris subsp. vulgaris]
MFMKVFFSSSMQLFHTFRVSKGLQDEDGLKKNNEAVMSYIVLCSQIHFGFWSIENRWVLTIWLGSN